MAYHLSDLVLPDDAVTQTFGLLGRRGSGKTHTATVFAEQLLDASQVIVWIDPMGVAWGLATGYPILIAGGKHGHFPLEQSAGVLFAEMIVAERISVVLDVSELSENGMRQFVGDFLQRLYELNTEAIHVFVDEADEYAPQSGGFGGTVAKSLGAMQRIVRRGRTRGIGATIISQRAAVINKSVFTQTECLIAHQTTGPQDLAAIKDWIKYHSGDERANEILQTLPKMKAGECWVYSPAWLGVLKRIKVQTRKTFDSSRTPKPGEQAAKPKSIHSIDLDSLKGKFAKIIEDKKANDPAVLKSRIKELEKRKDVIPQEEIDGMIAKAITQKNNALINSLKNIRANFQLGHSMCYDAICSLNRLIDTTEEHSTLPKSIGTGTQQPIGSVAVRQSPAEVVDKRSLDALDGPTRKILHSLAWWGSVGINSPKHVQVGFVAGYVASGGSYRKYISNMTSAGLVERPSADRVSLTASGQKAAPKIDSAGSLSELHIRIRHVVKQVPLIRMLDVIIASPSGVSVEAIGRETGYEPTGGTFRKYLSSLSSLGLVVKKNDFVYGTDVLFPGIQ